MRLFHSGRRQSSGGIAKERLSTLLAAERLKLFSESHADAEK